MNTHDISCPPPEELSALFDAETSRRSGALREHLRECPHCSALFEQFGAVRERLGPLKRPVDVDIAEAVLMRLPRRPPGAAHAPAKRPRRAMPQFGVRALGAAVSLGAGLYLGLSIMVGAGGVTAAGMTAFEAEPIGGFCAGLPSCVQLRR
jgi:predicted anti-sigma-YlaC factor YlaD